MLTDLRSISIATWILIALALLGALAFATVSFSSLGALAVRDIDKVLMSERATQLATWFKTNQRSDGSLPYAYDPATDTYSKNNNAIRQLIAVQGMYALGRSLGDAALLEAAERAEKNFFAHSYRNDTANGYAYITDDAGIKLGAAALGVLALREKGDLNRPLSVEEIRLGRFLLAQLRADGSFQTFLQEKKTDTNDRFYSGEALTAIARLARNSDNPAYDEALARSFPYYSDKLKKDFWPQYTSWHMQAYAIAYQNTGREEYATYVFWLAEGLIQTMLEADTGARANERGRFYNAKYPACGIPHSASTGVYVEGLTYAYELAVKKGDAKKVERYKEAILLGTRSLLEEQWLTEMTAGLAHPEKVVGAIKVDPEDGSLRIDQMGHAANALARIIDLDVLTRE